MLPVVTADGLSEDETQLVSLLQAELAGFRQVNRRKWE